MSNAGTARWGAVAELSEDDYDAVFRLNTKRTFFVLREAARRISDGGRIINISSSATAMSIPGLALYIGSKAAGEQFAKTLAREMGSFGRNPTILPGRADLAKRLLQAAPGLVILLLAGCRERVGPAYAGALGYWTAEARVRAMSWRCDTPDHAGVLECTGLVTDTSYFVRSASTGTLSEVRKRWQVPPGRLLRHLQLLAHGFSQGRPPREYGSGSTRRHIWRGVGHFAELSPATDSAGYLLVADTGISSRPASDTLPCPAA